MPRYAADRQICVQFMRPLNFYPATFSARSFRAFLVAGCLVALPTSRAGDASSVPDVVRQLNDAFATVAQKVSATVVVINVKQKPSEVEGQDAGSAEALPPSFWHHFVPDETMGQGSGIIVRPDGYLLTNSHVVEDAETIQIRLQDGRRFAAVVRGVDAQSDLAVLKIEAQDLPVVRFGDSAKTRVGEFAIAVGTPFSLDYSVTFGHVSAKGRSHVLEGLEGATMDQDFIQTDALINPGNSGGPLVNIDGEVIGINTLIRGMHSGIGFAIPSNLAKEVSDGLIAEGKFTRAWLGISIGGLRENEDLRDLIKGVDDGVVVSGILQDGPAAKSDLKAGDIITAVDGQPVRTPQDLRTEIRGKKIGQPVLLDVFRKSAAIQVKVSPGEWASQPALAAKPKATEASPSAAPSFGVTVQSITPELAARLGVNPGDGVLVASVDRNSPAARKGLKAGDIITSIDEQPTATPKQFNAALKKADLKKGILMHFISNTTPRFEVIKAQP